MSGRPDVVVLDNGGYSCKAGVGGQANPLTVPNCAIKPKRERRFFVADQISSILDFSQVTYRRPCEKGYITDWALEGEIWDRVYKGVVRRDPSACGLLVTEPVCNLRSLSRQMDEVAFEKFGVASFCRAPAPSLALYRLRAKEEGKRRLSETYTCVVDVGYSHTTIVPFVEEAPVNYAIRRVQVGGKLLTNYLKEVVSYRAFNVMDETHLINHVKESMCRVSLDYKSELEGCRSDPDRLRAVYAMPDHQDGKSVGRVLSAEAAAAALDSDEVQTLTLGNERITVPELLFRPNLIGIEQAGIGEAVVQAISACHKDIQGLLYANIRVIGGTARFPQFIDRLRKEIRACAPSQHMVSVRAEREPELTAWRGGSNMVATGIYEQLCVRKAEYQEYGSDGCRRRFFWY